MLRCFFLLFFCIIVDSSASILESEEIPDYRNLSTISFSIIFWGNLTENLCNFPSAISSALDRDEDISRIFVYDVRRYPLFPKTIVDFSIVGKEEIKKELDEKGGATIEFEFRREFGLNSTFFAPKWEDPQIQLRPELAIYVVAGVGGLSWLAGIVALWMIPSELWPDEKRRRRGRFSRGTKQKITCFVNNYFRPLGMTLR